MLVGALRFDLFLHGARSIKKKRAPLKRLIAQLQNKHSCGVAEVDFQDVHRRAAIGVAIVSSDRVQLERQMQCVREFVNKSPDWQVSECSQSVARGPKE